MACTVQAADPAQNGKIVVLSTNDVHCAISPSKEDGKLVSMGFPGVAAYKKEMGTLYGTDRVTMVDAGDAIQGEAIGTLSKGAEPLALMNAVGYDFAVPGNHEFDFGMDQLLTLAKKEASAQYLCANLLDKQGKPVFKPYAVVDYGNTQVGYVGIATPESFTKSTPAYFQDANGRYIYSFCEGNDGKDLYRAVQSAVDAARKDGADFVIAIGHLGNEGSTEAWRSDTVIRNTTGIDALIDGHSHEQYVKEIANQSGKPVVLLQTGTKLAALGRIEIDPAAGKVTGMLVTDYQGADPDVSEKVAQAEARFAETLNRQVARSEVALTTLDPATGERAVRSAETNLGDLCADAYRTMVGADAAFMNGGGIRADIAAGPVTYGQIIDAQPYGNALCLVRATGQQILDALELGAHLYPEENGGFLQVSGVTYAIDASIPSPVVVNDKNEFLRVDGMRRVHDVMIGGKPLDPKKSYTLASHNYMLKSGGDGFTMFRGSTLLRDGVMLDNEALIRYIVEELNGVVGKQYADPLGQGRIQFTAAEQAWTSGGLAA